MLSRCIYFLHSIDLHPSSFSTKKLKVIQFTRADLIFFATIAFAHSHHTPTHSIYTTQARTLKEEPSPS